MKINHILAASIFSIAFILNGCKKDGSNDDDDNNNLPQTATLTMRVNGLAVSKSNSHATFFNSGGQQSFFGVNSDRNDTVEFVSFSLTKGVELNHTYTIDTSCIYGSLYDRGSAIYNNMINASLLDFYSAGESQKAKAKLTYTITKIHNPADYIVKCDVEFNGVLYKRNYPYDSVVITNGVIKY